MLVCISNSTLIGEELYVIGSQGMPESVSIPIAPELLNEAKAIIKQKHLENRARLKMNADNLAEDDLRERFLYAIRCGSLDEIAAYSACSKTLDFREQTGMTLLASAVMNGRPNAVVILLEAGANPNFTVDVGGNRLTPLHVGSLSDSFECIAHLLDAGADDMRVDPRGLTPLEILESAGWGAGTTGVTLKEKVDSFLATRRQLRAKSPIIQTTEEENSRLQDSLIKREQNTVLREIVIERQATRSSSKFDPLTAKMSLAIDRGRFKESKKTTAEIRATTRSTALTEAFAGEAYFQLGQPHESIAHYSLALNEHPKYARWLADRARARIAIGQHELAEEDIQSALRLESDNSHILVVLGMLYQAQGQLVESKGAFERAADAQPNNADPQQHLAQLALERGDVKTAINYLSLSICCNPLNHASYTLRGQLLDKAGQTPMALIEYLKAMRAAPSRSWDAALGLGSLLCRMKLYSISLPYLSASINDRPANKEGYHWRSEALTALGFGVHAYVDLKLHDSLTNIESLCEQNGVSSVHVPLARDHEFVRKNREVKEVGIREDAAKLDWTSAVCDQPTIGRILACLTAAGKDEHEVLSLLALGVDINTKTPNGNTLLIQSVQLLFRTSRFQFPLITF